MTPGFRSPPKSNEVVAQFHRLHVFSQGFAKEQKMIGKGMRSDMAVILAMILGFAIIVEVKNPGTIHKMANEIQAISKSK